MKYSGELIQQNLIDLNNVRGLLAYSYGKCRRMVLRQGLTHEELESFEALNRRFARLSDLIIQKTFKSLDKLDLEDTGSVRDRINRAEKRGIIKNADEFMEIRILRNEIAHDYKSDSIFDIFERVLVYTPVLLNSVEMIQNYAEGKM